MGVDAAASCPVEDAAWPHAATALLGSLTAAAAALTGLALARVDTGSVDWTAFAVFAAGATLAYGIATESVRGWSFRPTGVFVIAALLVLPAGLAAVVALGAFAVSSVRERRERRKQLFSAATLPDAGPGQALEIAERIRAAVEQSEFGVDTSPEPIRATISVGVACYPRDADDPGALVHAADVGLYRAKGDGRNRVVYAGATTPA